MLRTSLKGRVDSNKLKYSFETYKSQNKGKGFIKNNAGLNNRKFQDKNPPSTSKFEHLSYESFFDKYQAEKDFHNTEEHRNTEEFDSEGQDMNVNPMKMTNKEYQHGVNNVVRDFKFEYKDLIEKLIDKNKMKNALTDHVEESLLNQTAMSPPLVRYKRDFATISGMKDVFFNFPNQNSQYAEFIPARLDITKEEIHNNIETNDQFENLTISNLRDSLTKLTEIPILTLPALTDIQIQETFYILKYVFVSESIIYFKFNPEIAEYLFYKILIGELKESDYPDNPTLKDLIEFGEETIEKLKDLKENLPFSKSIVEKQLMDFAKDIDEDPGEITKENIEIEKMTKKKLYSTDLFKSMIKNNDLQRNLKELSYQMILENNPLEFNNISEVKKFVKSNPEMKKQYKEHLEKIKKEESENPDLSLSATEMIRKELDEMNLNQDKNLTIVDNLEENPIEIQELQYMYHLSSKFNTFENPYTDVFPLSKGFINSISVYDENLEKDVDLEDDDEALDKFYRDGESSYEYSEDYHDSLAPSIHPIHPYFGDFKNLTERQRLFLQFQSIENGNNRTDNYINQDEEADFRKGNNENSDNIGNSNVSGFEEEEESISDIAFKKNIYEQLKLVLEIDDMDWNPDIKLENGEEIIRRKTEEINQKDIEEEEKTKEISKIEDLYKDDSQRMENEIMKRRNKLIDEKARNFDEFHYSPEELKTMTKKQWQVILDSDNVFEQYWKHGDKYYAQHEALIQEKKQKLLEEEKETETESDKIIEVEQNQNENVDIPKEESEEIFDPIKHAEEDNKETENISELDLIVAIEEQRKIDPTICVDNAEVDFLKRHNELTTINSYMFDSVAYRKQRFMDFYGKKVFLTYQKNLQNYEDIHKAIEYANLSSSNLTKFDQVYPIFAFQLYDTAEFLYKNLNRIENFSDNMKLFKDELERNDENLSNGKWISLKQTLKNEIIMMFELKCSFDLFGMKENLITEFLKSPQEILYKCYNEGDYENIVKALILLACKNKNHNIPEIFHDEKIFAGLEREYKILFDVLMTQVLLGEPVVMTDILEHIRFFPANNCFSLLSKYGLEKFMIIQLNGLIEYNIKKFGSANFDFLPIAFHLNQIKNNELLTSLNMENLTDQLLNIVWFQKESEAASLFEKTNKFYKQQINISSNKPLQALMLELFFKSKDYKTALANYQMFTFLLSRLYKRKSDYSDILERLKFLNGEKNFELYFQNIMPRIIKMTSFSVELDKYLECVNEIQISIGLSKKINAYDDFGFTFFKSNTLQTIFQSNSVPKINYNPYILNHMDFEIKRKEGINIKDLYRKALINVNEKDAINYLQNFVKVYKNEDYEELKEALKLKTSNQNVKFNAISYHLMDKTIPRKKMLDLEPSPRLYNHRYNEQDVNEIVDLLSQKLYNQKLNEMGVITDLSQGLKSKNITDSSDGEYNLNAVLEKKESHSLQNKELSNEDENSQQSDSYFSEHEQNYEDFENMGKSEMEEMLKMGENRELPYELNIGDIKYDSYYKYQPNEELYNMHYRIKPTVPMFKKKPSGIKCDFLEFQQFHSSVRRNFSSLPDDNDIEKDDFSLLDDYLQKENEGFNNYLKKAAEIDKDFENSSKMTFQEKKMDFENKRRINKVEEQKENDKRKILDDIRNEILSSQTLEKAKDFITLKIRKIYSINDVKAFYYIDSLIKVRNLPFEGCSNGFQFFVLLFFRNSTTDLLEENENLIFNFELKAGTIERNYNQYLTYTSVPFALSPELYYEIFAYLQRNFKRSFFKKAFSHLLRYSDRIDGRILDKIIKTSIDQKNGITLFEMTYAMVQKQILNENNFRQLIKGIFNFRNVYEDVYILIMLYYKNSDKLKEMLPLQELFDCLVLKGSAEIALFNFEKLKDYFVEKKLFKDDTISEDEYDIKQQAFKQELYIFLYQYFLIVINKFLESRFNEEAALIFQMFITELNPPFTKEEYIMAFQIYKHDAEKAVEFYMGVVKFESLCKVIKANKKDLGEMFLDIMNKFIYSKNIEIDNAVIDEIIGCFTSTGDVNNMGDFMRYLIKKKFAPHKKTMVHLNKAIRNIEDDHSKGYIKGLSNQLFTASLKKRTIAVEESEIKEEEKEESEADEENDLDLDEFEKKSTNKHFEDFGIDPAVERRLEYTISDIIHVPEDYMEELEKLENMTPEQEEEEIRKIIE